MILAHFIFCLLFFLAVQRPAFMIANRGAAAAGPTRAEVKAVYRAGIKTDVAASAYLTALPLIVVTVHGLWPGFDIKVPLLVVEGVVALTLSLAAVADTALYGYWKTKIDASVFAYLRYIGGAFASVTATYAVVAVLAVAVLAGAVFAALWGIDAACGAFQPVEPPGAGRVIAVAGLFLLWGGVLFACIRGLAHRPISPAVACHCTDPFRNHCALNPVYNVIYTVSLSEKSGNPFRSIPREECDAKVHGMFPVDGSTATDILNTSRPNVLLIVWESLCEHFVEAIGGKPGVTPNLSRLASEGVLFTNVAAGSWRTDPALVCTLSGMIAQPTANVIRQDKKLPHLPALPRTLRDAGYSTYAFHGGSLNYMNFVGYFIASGHSSLVGRPDLPADAPSCSWGVHDGYMFSYLYDQITGPLAQAQPWYATFLTLSSHQPFKVPYSRLDDPIDNAFAYTDECFGDFIERLKKTPQWRDLLIVVTGDHGINETSLGMTRQQSSHIPMLMLGGAVTEPRRIDTIMSQSDLPATLLGQMGMPHRHFPFSRDVLADTYTDPFSLHVYGNGFAVRDAYGFTDFDIAAGAAVEGADPARENRGRMTLQTLYDYIADLGIKPHK